jgi:hypothetical protein
MPSSVPPIIFTPAGVVIPPESSILAGVQSDINAAFGGGLNPALETPQGQLASSQAAVIADKNSEIALIVNQVDPLYASDRFQDAIGRIYFLERKAATATAVTATLGGLVGTPVPAGTFAQDLSGNTYVLLGDVIIGAGGTVSSSWQNIATGPIPCPANTLVKVYQAVPGWDTITNPADGTLGQDVETRAEFEFRRQNSVALNSRGTCPSIYGNVFEKVLGALDCYVIDNPAGITVLKGPTNYPMAHNSLFVAVIGGTDAEVAQAIWEKKDNGCSYAAWPDWPSGSTVPGMGTVASETVLDPSGYSFPQPSYEVSFIRPGPLAIKFAVRIVNLPSLPANITTLIQNAIVAQFNGTNGSVRARIGAAILAANYYAPVALAASNVQLISVLVGTATPTDTQVDVGIDQAPTLDPADITVTLV